MGLRLGDILVEKRVISPEQLKLAVEEQQKSGQLLGEVLIRMGFLTERRMLEVLAQQQGTGFLNLKEIKIDEKVIKAVPPKFAWHYKIMPVNLEGDILTIALANPFDMWPIEDLETNLGLRVEKVLATSMDIQEAIKKYYGVGGDTIEQIMSDETRHAPKSAPAAEDKVDDLEKLAGDASVIRLVNQILEQAINDRATDIHIEHFRGELILRFRIDGILYDVPASADIKYLYNAIISRLKVMSGLDIIERRVPQDGRSKVRLADKEYDLRISIIPAIHGEGIVIRILPTGMLFNIADLGMCKRDIEIVEGLIKKPHGIIFVTGPTGSGKSTTLYSFLSKLNTRSTKIVTVEDPVEYELKGILQIQVNPKVGLTFASALRSMLRHDPDLMMVGEVRDFETADITIQTALTGHLVFSTLHTNDSASAVTRLVDIGIEPYLLASAVEVFIAQRLVRVICKNCKAKAAPCAQEIKMLQAAAGPLYQAASEVFIYRGAGCNACNNTGYMGRTGIYEILLVDEEIRQLIMQKVPSSQIKEQAVKSGMRLLRQDGYAKILEGVTTLEEVMRVTQQE